MPPIYNAPSVLELRSHCPGSGVLSSKMPRTEQSAKGAKGDIVHDAIMLKLKRGTSPSFLENEYDRNTVNVAAKLVDAWLKKQTGQGLEKYQKRKAIHVEKSLNLGHVGWPGNAKADVIVDVDATTRLILEIKTGEWEVTGPSANRQGHAYVCGEARIAPDANLFYLVILQPALIEELQWRESKYNRAEAEALAEQIRGFVKATFDPEAPLVWGEWCARCPASEMCPARRGTLTEMAKVLEEVGPTVGAYMDKLRPVERSAAMAKMKVTEATAKKFLELAKAWRLNTPDAELPGWKVGPGRGTRTFSGAAPDTAKKLYAAFGAKLKAKLGVDSPEGLLTVLSPSSVESALGKAEKEQLVAMDVVTKEVGALSVIEDKPTPMPKPRED